MFTSNSHICRWFMAPSIVGLLMFGAAAARTWARRLRTGQSGQQ